MGRRFSYTLNQTAEMIAQWLVDRWHGIPLSDGGANLLSTVTHDICAIPGMKKVNATAYRLQK